MSTAATVAQRLAWHVAHAQHCACRPMPPALAAALGTATAASRSALPLRPLLARGDRRSIAGSNRVLALVLATPARLAEVAALVADPDWLVSLRALDVLEKLVHEHAAWVQPHRGVFIGPLADSDKWEHRLQVVRALPFLAWTRRERRRVVAILRRDLVHPQLFVRAWALDSLARLAQDDLTLRPEVRRHLAAFARSGRPALVARAGKIRRRLGRARRGAPLPAAVPNRATTAHNR